MITLLGIGHVFDLRARITEEIFRRAPSVVALELDPVRYRALLAPPQSRKGAPLAYRLVAHVQDRIAAAYGVRAGDEMRAASDAARDLRVPVALIDADAQRLFQRLRSEMPLREKLRLAGAAVGGMVMPSRGIEAQVEALTQDYALAFGEMEQKFPTLKRILIDERNAHMAKALVRLQTAHENVLAVVGDGHVDGMLEVLAKEEATVQAVRLRDLRTRQPAEGTASAGFSVEWKD